MRAKKSATPGLTTRRTISQFATPRFDGLLKNCQGPQNLYPFCQNQFRDSSFSSQFLFMYQDDSLSSLDRRRMHQFLTDRRRMERI